MRPIHSSSRTQYQCLVFLCDIVLQARLFVIRVVTENTRTISTHRHGCCVVQRCLDATTPETPDTAADRAKLVAKIIENAMTLMQNAYGGDQDCGERMMGSLNFEGH